MKKFIVSGGLLFFSLLISVPEIFAQAGQLDPTFGTGGVVQTEPLTGFTAAALAPNGDIVVAGQSGRTATMVRYLTNGALDSSFGTGGILTLPPPASFFLGGSFSLGVAVQRSGKILATFFAYNPVLGAIGECQHAISGGRRSSSR